MLIQFAGHTGPGRPKSDDASPIVTSYLVRRISTTNPRELDTVKYRPRTLAPEIRLFVNKPDWEGVLRTWRRMFNDILFRDMLWAFVSDATARSCAKLGSSG